MQGFEQGEKERLKVMEHLKIRTKGVQPRRHAAGFRMAFTLIEVLVTITIISVLVSFTAPALSDAKLRAKDIQCAQNMKQIHLAIMLYINDHDQTFPSFTIPAWNHQYEQLTVFTNMIGQLDFYRCPLSKGDVKNVGGYFYIDGGGNRQWTEYKVNDDEYQVQGRPVGYQVRPQQVVYLIDAAEGWAPRHRYGAKSNLCFSDGHVEMLDFATYMGPERGYQPAASAPVGWVRWGLYDAP